MNLDNCIDEKLTALDQVLSTNKRIKTFFPDKQACGEPSPYLDVDTQDEICLRMQTGEHITRGATTIAGWLGGIPTILSLTLIVDFNSFEDFYGILLFFVFLIIAPLLWDLFSPMPYPVIFNRRTQEVYAYFKGELYHTRWDRARAIAYEDYMVNQYSGKTNVGYLEILLQGYNDPDKWIWANLSMPLGRTIEMQSSLWEYLRSYMNNGPWFDEHGNPSASDRYNRQQLEAYHETTRQRLKAKRANIRPDDATSRLAYYVYLIWSPMEFLKEWVYAMALKRSVRTWPKEVQERLKPNGPTTSLTELQQAKQT
ncbi:hypothetical protein B6S09_17750 [Oceanimonas baumannii]|uniref:DUF6708 domain-containing protein n=1 Tax=Oceanimonas baumannii TaxID=129578 RepID=A0A235C9D4_9GAMM|nr:DUF6708 domain-containing protein [Oceanimonas baumannii]OYD21036.1 hypothetical protein B6S09_17750 [Oceanimonas baumannii]